jgi:pimeloyl-ACP methyl ester carboxylesterase
MRRTVTDLEIVEQAARELGLGPTWVPAVRRTELSLAGGDRICGLEWHMGPPEFVFLHGGSQNAHTWDAVALLLGRPCVALDLPGHGRSSWRADGTYDPRVMCDAVGEAMRILASRPVVLVGQSLGGLTAIALAARYPGLVERLAVIDVTPAAGDKRRLASLRPPRTSFASIDEMVEQVYRPQTGRSLESFRRGVLANSAQRPDGTWAWQWDPAKSTSKHRVDWDGVWDDLSRTTAPLLFVRAGSSRVVRDEDLAEVRRLRPDADVVVITGAGHSVQGSRPRELARELAHLARVDHRTAAHPPQITSPAYGEAFPTGG